MDEELTWETLSDETAYACPGFDIIHETVRLPNGTETDFDYLQEGDSVVILPFTADGNVIVIEEWRQAVKRVNQGLPAGSVEGDEDGLTDAVYRELREETGYEAETVTHLYTAEPANGYADSQFHYFVARGCEATAEQELDHDETIRVGTSDVESLVQSVRDGTLRDGRSAIGVMYYALFEQ